MNLLYPDFSEDESTYLALACIEEIKYWKRMTLGPVSLDDPLDKEKKHVLFEKYPGLREKIEEGKERNISRYLGLKQKIKDKDKEYNAEDIHWLKIMCQERIPQIKRHVVAKQQMDGSFSLDHADKILIDILDRSKQTFIKIYNELAEKLSRMDTIPGDGMQEPVGFKFKV